MKDGRGERIRTSGPCLPKTVLYQAELLPDRNPQFATRSRREPRPRLDRCGARGAQPLSAVDDPGFVRLAVEQENDARSLGQASVLVRLVLDLGPECARLKADALAFAGRRHPVGPFALDHQRPIIGGME